METATSFKTGPKAKGQNISSVKPISLSSIPSKSTARSSTKISELDRVLGGGLVPGQTILLAGEPGIGKSTILLQVANRLGNTVYVSGEESVHQIKIRADRLGIKNKKILVLEETNIDSILHSLESDRQNKPKLVIIDSIQTMSTGDLSGMAGSVGQVRESAYRLVRFAKRNNVPVFIVGHVTKQGSVAGPAVLMHIVDSVLWFEGDKSLTLRLLRAVKNRFGPTDEVGIFSMEDKGLVSQDNPEELFLDKGISTPGSVTTSVLQGTRPILVEIQALVVPTKMAFPRRVAQGIDSKRLELLLAVLIRRCGLPLYDTDVFVNISGGITLKNDPSVDLAVCLAIASAYIDKGLPPKSVAVGEIGLLGDIRKVVAEEKRIKEAKRLGFKSVISSKNSKYLREAIKKYLR